MGARGRVPAGQCRSVEKRSEDVGSLTWFIEIHPFPFTRRPPRSYEFSCAVNTQHLRRISTQMRRFSHLAQATVCEYDGSGNDPTELTASALEADVDIEQEGTTNARTVARFYQSERDRDLSLWVTFWRRDGRQTFPTLGPDATVAGIASLASVTKEKFTVRPPYGIEAVVDPLADPRLVLARLALDFPEQPLVHLWCLFHFDTDGLIVEVEEIFDRGPAA